VGPIIGPAWYFFLKKNSGRFPGSFFLYLVNCNELQKNNRMLSGITDEIKLKTGTSTTVKLKGLATAGYEWNYAIDDNNDCINVSKEIVLPEKLTQKNMGASADEVFTIIAQKKGKVNIHFSQQRSWEKNIDPVNEKKVKIIIE
jgi:predicted secreted protein